MNVLSLKRLAVGAALVAGLMTPPIVRQAQADLPTSPSAPTSAPVGATRVSAGGADSGFDSNSRAGRDAMVGQSGSSPAGSSSPRGGKSGTGSTGTWRSGQGSPGGTGTSSAVQGGAGEMDAVPGNTGGFGGGTEGSYAPNHGAGPSSGQGQVRTREGSNLGGSRASGTTSDFGQPGNVSGFGSGDDVVLPGPPVTLDVPTFGLSGTVTNVRSDAIDIDTGAGRAVIPTSLGLMTGGVSAGGATVGSQVSLMIPTFTGAMQWLQDGRLTLRTGTGGSITLPAGVLPQAFLNQNSVLVRSRNGSLARVPLASAMNLESGTVLTSLPPGAMATAPSGYGSGAYGTAPANSNLRYGSPGGESPYYNNVPASPGGSMYDSRMPGRSGVPGGSTGTPGTSPGRGNTFGTPTNDLKNTGTPANRIDNYGTPSNRGNTFGAPGTSPGRGNTFGTPTNDMNNTSTPANRIDNYGTPSNRGNTFGAPGTSPGRGNTLGTPTNDMNNTSVPGGTTNPSGTTP